MKICTKCKIEKPLSEFHRWAVTADGYQYNCKVCKAAYRKVIDQQPHNLVKTKAYHIKRKYGITIEQYDELFEEQNHRCAICNRTETHRSRSGKVTPLAVDHDHETGIVRGLLCSSCNTSLGGFRDSVELLERAIDYLRKQEVKNVE